MSNNYDVKQVILVRTDLKNTQGHKVRSAKMNAQIAHAAMIWLSNRVNGQLKDEVAYITGRGPEPGAFMAAFTAAERMWLAGSFAKIVLAVDSLAEMIDLVQKAQAAGIGAHIVTDSGMTEFGGVPTMTCAGIGPADSAELDKVTGHLRPL